MAAPTYVLHYKEQHFWLGTFAVPSRTQRLSQKPRRGNYTKVGTVTVHVDVCDVRGAYDVTDVQDRDIGCTATPVMMLVMMTTLTTLMTMTTMTTMTTLTRFIIFRY